MAVDLGQSALDIVGLVPEIASAFTNYNPWDSEEKHGSSDLMDLMMGSLPDYYLPGGEQWVTQLDDPRYIGSMEGYMYDDADWYRVGSKDKYQMVGEDIGRVDTSFDYGKLGLSDSLLGQLRNLFTARGTGSMKDEGTQYATWTENPEGSTSPEDLDKIGETGSYGAIDFSQYANIFDRQNLANMLSMITGKKVGAWELPQIGMKDVAETQEAYYTPLEVKKRGSILDQIMSKYQEASYGGLAGSGGRDRHLRGVRTAYDEEMENIWASISEAAGAAEESLSDKLSQIHDIRADLS